jgi:hypothetical protein
MFDGKKHVTNGQHTVCENVQIHVYIRKHMQRIQGRKLLHPNFTEVLSEKEIYMEVGSSRKRKLTWI